MNNDLSFTALIAVSASFFGGGCDWIRRRGPSGGREGWMSVHGLDRPRGCRSNPHEKEGVL
jgi:hypothetical protein